MNQTLLAASANHLVLDEFQLITENFGILLQILHGIGGGGKTVHEHELHGLPERLAHFNDLLCDEVKEGVLTLDLEQRLGLYSSCISTRCN